MAGAGCSAGPSQRPAVAYHDAEQQVPPAPQPPGPAPVPPLGAPGGETLDWSDCREQTAAELGVPAPAEPVSCAQLRSVLDPPEAPTRGTARSEVIKFGEGVPLLVLSDVAGEPGTTAAARMALRLPPEVRERFAVIGIDRRGTGASDPAECVPPEHRATIAGFDPLSTDRAELDVLLDSVRSASQECLLTLDERLQAYDTWRTAADLEQLRVELGVDKLHAIGRGEAGRLLTTYTERFPESVGRMVVDGAPDPTRDAAGEAELRAEAAEQTLDQFAADCAARRCPLGPDARAAVLDLLDSARTAPPAGPDGPVPPGRIARALLLGLEEPARWPELAQGLADAARGDGSWVATATAPVVEHTGADPPWLDGELITGCNDTTMRVPPERSADLAAEWSARFPVFGALSAQQLVWCGLWPAPQQPLPTPKQAGLPPIPVIATEHDVRSNELGTEHLADQLESGVPVRWQGSGHGAVGRSECITDAVSRFLLDGTVPTEGMVCPG
nr:alpha/beta hydrolase [Saccharopolyspora sp. HNM0983]